MTRKDYEFIAAAIREAITNDGVIMSPDREVVMAGNIASRIAAGVAQDDPRFDRARFMRACGL